MKYGSQSNIAVTIIKSTMYSHHTWDYISTRIKKLGCKDFGAPKIKLGFTAQKIRDGIRRRLI